MPTMSNYCKAYPVSRFREYQNWREKTPPLVTPSTDESSGSSGGETEEYYYLHDNYIVTAGIFTDEHVAFDDVSERWKQFCHDRLEFQIPPEALE